MRGRARDEKKRGERAKSGRVTEGKRKKKEGIMNKTRK